jgi:hypothetical protein
VRILALIFKVCIIDRENFASLLYSCSYLCSVIGSVGEDGASGLW